MHLDKWLSAQENNMDLLTRQLVVQQVANFLAAIHGCGSEEKLCLWGSFVGKIFLFIYLFIYFFNVRFELK